MFASQLSGKKSDSGALSAKVEIRRRVMEEIESPAVLDCFAGSGEMYRAVWHQAKWYVGCDKRWFEDERLAYVADNRRLLRCIDLSRFNIFDLDSYGAPWEQAIIVARRRIVKKGERVGLVLTEGSGLNLKMGGMPKSLAAISGVRKNVSGGAKLQDEIIDRAISGIERIMRARVDRQLRAKGKKGSAMRYIGLTLVGINDAEGHEAGSDTQAEDSVADPS